MELTLPETTQRPWRHRSRSSGQHPAAHYQSKPRWDSNHGWDGAITGLKDGKVPGGDGIPVEVWKHEGDNLFSRPHQLITNAWEVGSVPQAWKDTSIVTIYKKGDRTYCGNYRGISLLSIAGKIFARILLNRLSTHITSEIVPEPGYGSYWGSMDAQRSSQLWSRHYIPDWWRMLVLEVKSRNRSVLQMGSSKVVYWLSKTWGMASVYSPEGWPIQRRTLQSEDQDYSDTDERAAIRRLQCPGCPLCWRYAENSGCFLWCVKEVRPEGWHQEDWGDVPTQLYKNPRGGHHGWWKQAELRSGIYLPRKYYIK